MTLSDAAHHVLTEPQADEKVRLSRLYAKRWFNKQITEVGNTALPVRPARTPKPELLSPRDMPRRRLGSEAGRIALIHAIAHIELNAIDLAWDMVARFNNEDLPPEFYDDWVRVADDEARHFHMLNKRLGDFGKCYGDFPAHDGLWDAASSTAHDLLARLALVPMVLEPRGLDTTPATVEKLRNQGDDKTANVMEQIGREEIDHVAAGTRWFKYISQKRELNPVETYHQLVTKYFAGGLKGPFNVDARSQAGMTAEFYEPLSQ